MSTYRQDLDAGDIPGAMNQLERASATGVVTFKDVAKDRAAVCLAVHDTVHDLQENLSHTTSGNMVGAFFPFAIKSQLRDLNDQLTDATGVSALDMDNPGGYTASKELMKEFSGDPTQQLSLLGGDIASTVTEYEEQAKDWFDSTKYYWLALAAILILYIVAKRS
jgi:hypothetical protein